MKHIIYCIALTFSVATQVTSSSDDVMLLFKKINTGEIEFITTIFPSYHPEQQKILLSATNDSYQTPLHYALSLHNILASFALVNIIQDDSLFLFSDAEENTPFSLAKDLSETNLARQIYEKIPPSIQKNLEL